MPEAQRARRVAPRLFQWSIFPVVLGAVTVATIFLIQRGVAPSVAILGPQFAAFAVVMVLEHVYPYHRRWNLPRHDVGTDIAHSLGVAATVALSTPLALSLGVAIGGVLTRGLGSGLWPDSWPLLAQLPLALVIGEIPGYWIHRWQHHYDALWRFHAVHHSAPRLYWLNAGRFHPVDSLMTFFPAFALLIALGCPEATLALFTLVTAVHGIFQHANLQLRLGPLNHFFSMAELHRWHHSKTLDEANRNFGQTVIVWDTLFGTRFLPADRTPPEEIGILDLEAFPMTWWSQILSPLRWRRIREESARIGP